MSTINFSLDGSPAKDVACEAIDCLNSETLTLYFSGLEGDVLSFNSFQNILSRQKFLILKMRPLSLRPDKKIYLFSVPARPENFPRPQFFFYFLFL